MDLSSDKVRGYTRRVLLSRMRLLSERGFYGVLLMHMGICLGDEHGNAWYTEERIFLNPAFLEVISDEELDYVLEHEILHVVLRHKTRKRGYDPARFDKACDVVANSIILESHYEDSRSITLRCHGGIQPHLAPDGSEGREHTAEEVYALMSVSADDGGDEDCGDGGDGLGCPSSRGNGRLSDASGNGGRASRGKAEGGEEGGSYCGWDSHFSESELIGEEDGVGYHDDVWAQRLMSACESILICDSSEGCGSMPAFASRFYRETRSFRVDWRTILNDFIQEVVCDYSFMPPDRRLDDCDFFLPDFNDVEATVKDVLFMVDASRSMSDDAIAAAYSEVKGAIGQFGGKLAGWLGFFDAAVTPPVPFVGEDELAAIKPHGGGGTSYRPIFEYVEKNMLDEPPASIVVLTDGFAEWPDEEIAHDIPVLWLVNNGKADPPWGKVARMDE